MLEVETVKGALMEKISSHVMEMEVLLPKGRHEVLECRAGEKYVWGENGRGVDVDCTLKLRWLG